MTGPESISDESLLFRVARGDRPAFDELYHRHAGWLALRLRRRCGDDDLVADLLQESFLTVWRMAPSFSAKGSAAGWIWSIASSRMIDAHRRRAVRPHTGAELHDSAVISPSAEDEALTAHYGDRMAAALQRLSPELRAVLQATVLDGMTLREASVVFGLPEGTLKSRANRARQQLRQELA